MANPAISLASFDQNDMSRRRGCCSAKRRAAFSSSGTPGRYTVTTCCASADGSTRFRIGDQLFADMPALLSFYRLHYLDTTPLVRPLSQASVKAPPQPQVLEVVVAKFDFFGNRLMVVGRDEEQWWTARNAQGRTGSIPVPYVQR
ncbi:hypothetical protein MSG28_011601, partial [Choristoneura fumiferana]